VDWLRKIFRRERVEAGAGPDMPQMNPYAAEPALPGARDDVTSAEDAASRAQEGDEPKEPRSL
jgi:hypothetical protein